MTLREAQTACMEIERMGELKQVKWTDVFENEGEIVKALEKVYIPKNRTAPPCTFIGYEFIYSFAYYVRKGWKLTEKQMRQCKRLALQIKKAAAIADYQF